MSRYEVRITEILSRIVTVDAEDEIDAQVKVDEMYSNEQIVLDWSDVENVTIEVV